MTRRPRLVCAGSYDEFLDWCRENQVSPHAGDAVYVRGTETLLGREARDVVVYGSFWQRRDAAALYDAAQVRLHP